MVNLNRLAPHIESDAKTVSVHRRLERFFREVRLDGAEVGAWSSPPWGWLASHGHSAMDRTNWKVRQDRNERSGAVGDGEPRLRAAVLEPAWQGGQLEHRRAHRPDDKFIATFPDQKVASFAGDREFIGNRWIAWVQEHEIPHVLRLREGMKVFDPVHEPDRSRSTCSPPATWPSARADRRVAHRPVRSAEASPPVRIVIMRLDSGEVLALASRTGPTGALALDPKSWRKRSNCCSAR